MPGELPGVESWDTRTTVAGGGLRAQCKFLLSSCWSSVWTRSYTLWCMTSVWGRGGGVGRERERDCIKIIHSKCAFKLQRIQDSDRARLFTEGMCRIDQLEWTAVPCGLVGLIYLRHPPHWPWAWSHDTVLGRKLLSTPTAATAGLCTKGHAINNLLISDHLSLPLCLYLSPVSLSISLFASICPFFSLHVTYLFLALFLSIVLSLHLSVTFSLPLFLSLSLFLSSSSLHHQGVCVQTRPPDRSQQTWHASLALIHSEGLMCVCV